MLSIVTDPDIDYIFVTDFDVLENHLNNIVNPACRTVSTTTATTISTPSTSVTKPATVLDPRESMLGFLTYLFHRHSLQINEQLFSLTVKSVISRA